VPAIQPDSPYWIPRSVAESVLRTKGLVAVAEIASPRGQHWKIPGGPMFAVQWFGDQDQYVDQTQVGYVYEAVADWHAKNPNRLN
jgi:hypothetical protein